MAFPCSGASPQLLACGRGGPSQSSRRQLLWRVAVVPRSLRPIRAEADAGSALFGCSAWGADGGPQEAGLGGSAVGGGALWRRHGVPRRWTEPQVSTGYGRRLNYKLAVSWRFLLKAAMAVPPGAVGVPGERQGACGRVVKGAASQQPRAHPSATAALCFAACTPAVAAPALGFAGRLGQPAACHGDHRGPAIPVRTAAPAPSHCVAVKRRTSYFNTWHKCLCRVHQSDVIVCGLLSPRSDSCRGHPPAQALPPEGGCVHLLRGQRGWVWDAVSRFWTQVLAMVSVWSRTYRNSTYRNSTGVWGIVPLGVVRHATSCYVPVLVYQTPGTDPRCLIELGASRVAASVWVRCRAPLAVVLTVQRCSLPHRCHRQPQG